MNQIVNTYWTNSASQMCDKMSVDVMPIVTPLILIVHGSEKNFRFL